MSRSEKSEDDIIMAQAVALEQIPVIDFAPFLSGDTTQRQAVADEIARACEMIGFFYLKGHGVDPALQGALFDQSAAFFHLPDAEKEGARATSDWYRGWVPSPRSEAWSRDTRLFDQYRLQLEWPSDAPADDPYAGIFARKNRWPEDMPAFRAASEGWLSAMHHLSVELLRAFALGLGLEEGHFDGWFNAPPSQLSLLHYPSLPEGVDVDVSNTVSHTDEGPVTILAQHGVDGLEVKRRDGVWIQAPPIEDAFTINVGDMMMWWSNGRFLSNYHRVKNTSGGERLSIPFFCNPDRDVIVGPLPELLDGNEPLYPYVRVADHLARFYKRLESRAA
jgi:isopenicillin N synthase-like dioxygenase